MKKLLFLFLFCPLFLAAQYKIEEILIYDMDIYGMDIYDMNHISINQLNNKKIHIICNGQRCVLNMLVDNKDIGKTVKLDIKIMYNPYFTKTIGLQLLDNNKNKGKINLTEKILEKHFGYTGKLQNSAQNTETILQGSYIITKEKTLFKQ